jgi:hypothetical protein
LTDDPYYLLGRACGLAEDIARAKGKICDLAFGYQGGLGAWIAQAPDDGPSTDDDIRRYQRNWRARHPYTVAFWKGIDRKAITAVRTPGKIIEYKRLPLVRDENFLRITLPSGRASSYPFPRITTDNKYGEPRVIFKDASMGKWSDCRFGQGAYGGLWVENIVSGIARDLLAAAMLRLEAAGYWVVLTVHDEVVVEVPDGFGSLDEFQRLITAAPDWVTGSLPIAAKIRESQRFSKPDSANGKTVPDTEAYSAADNFEIADGDSEPEAYSETKPDSEPKLGGADRDELAAVFEAGAGDGHSDQDGLSAAVLRVRTEIQNLYAAPPLHGGIGNRFSATRAAMEKKDGQPIQQDDAEPEPGDGGAGNGAAESSRGNGPTVYGTVDGRHPPKRRRNAAPLGRRRLQPRSAACPPGQERLAQHPSTQRPRIEDAASFAARPGAEVGLRLYQ